MSPALLAYDRLVRQKGGMRELIIATKNEKKLHELKRYLKGIKAFVISLKDFEKVPKIIENGRTFKENAVKKALIISKFTNRPVLSDDSGLAVDALNGQPGIRSSRFAGSRKSDKENTRKLIHLLEDVPLSKRQARFICAVAIADRGKTIKIIEESCEGLIAFAPKGRHGFGYDPVFLIPKYNKTFGELGLKVKDRMSHRSKALKKARRFLKDYLQRNAADV